MIMKFICLEIKIIIVFTYFCTFVYDKYTKENKSNFHHDKFQSWDTKTSTQLWKDAWRVVFSAK